MGKRVMLAGGVLLLLLSLDSCFVGERAGVASSSPGIEGLQWYLIEVGGAPVSNSAGAQRPFLKNVATGTPTLTGTVWEWVGTVYNDDRHVAVADPRKYTVQFQGDETLHVKADCNQKGGSYSTSAEDRRLSIEITHSTMAACPEGSLENAFVRGLSAAASYFIKDGDLYLDLKYDSGTMRFHKQKEQIR